MYYDDSVAQISMSDDWLPLSLEQHRTGKAPPQFINTLHFINRIHLENTLTLNYDNLAQEHIIKYRLPLSLESTALLSKCAHTIAVHARHAYKKTHTHKHTHKHSHPHAHTHTHTRTHSLPPCMALIRTHTRTSQIETQSSPSLMSHVRNPFKHFSCRLVCARAWALCRDRGRVYHSSATRRYSDEALRHVRKSEYNEELYGRVKRVGVIINAYD